MFPNRHEMSTKRSHTPRPTAAPSPFAQARDELFQHIISCDVVGAEPDHQKEWFDQTMPYMADRFHELGAREMAELRTLGERFAKPAKRNQAVSA